MHPSVVVLEVDPFVPPALTALQRTVAWFFLRARDLPPEIMSGRSGRWAGRCGGTRTFPNHILGVVGSSFAAKSLLSALGCNHSPGLS